MSRGAQFRYALEPLLLTRQWDLDDLLRQLGERNAECASAQSALELLCAHLAAAAAQWHGLSGHSGHLSVDRFTLLARYMRDQERQIRQSRAALEILLAERSTLIDQVVLSQRAVEAVEEHRDASRAQFIKLRMSGEFKLADDQWNILQSRIGQHES